jgi:hypothetical protein
MGVLRPSKWRKKKRQARADCVQPSWVPTSLIYLVGPACLWCLVLRKKVSLLVGLVVLLGLFIHQSLRTCWEWTKNSEWWHHRAYAVLIVERHNHCFREMPLNTPHGARFGTLSHPLLWASMVVKGCQTVHLWLLWALFGKEGPQV